MPFQWIFHAPLAEQIDAFAALAGELAAKFGAELSTAPRDGDLIFRTIFPGDDFDAEETGREFWQELYSRCLDANLALELVDSFPAPGALQPSPEVETGSQRAALAVPRGEIPEAPLYDILRADDPDMDRNLDETIAWIEAAGLPVINLLSYLDLPLYRAYAAEHEDERDQNMFLHMLHTWTCYRRYGAVLARIPLELARAFVNPIYLRLNTTQFRAPAPALCLMFPPWEYMVGTQWVKEIYITHLEPPTPADDRELTFMIVSHDERGECGFITLEVPLSLPGVGESIDAFFASPEDADLRRLTVIAATYCLYATARDRKQYLGSAGPDA